jgi:hypothetical protein
VSPTCFLTISFCHSSGNGDETLVEINVFPPQSGDHRNVYGTHFAHLFGFIGHPGEHIVFGVRPVITGRPTEADVALELARQVTDRVPDRPDHYLTHPYGMFWEEATASSFVTITAEGTPVHDDRRWTNDGAVNLCRWIFGARPDIDFFIHGHEVPIAAVGSLE